MVEGPPDRRTRLLVLGAGPGAARAARRRAQARSVRDRGRPEPGRARVPLRRPARDHLDRGRARDRAARRGRARRRPDRARHRLAGRDRGAGRAKLGLPHPLAPESAVLATSKTRQRERFAAAGVPQPEYARAGRSTTRAGRGRARLSVCREGAGPAGPARNVDRSGRQELDAAVATAVELSRSGGFLVEQLVSGQEVTVNAFLVGGASTRSRSPTGISRIRRRSASRSRTRGRVPSRRRRSRRRSTARGRPRLRSGSPTGRRTRR